MVGNTEPFHVSRIDDRMVPVRASSSLLLPVCAGVLAACAQGGALDPVLGTGSGGAHEVTGVGGAGSSGLAGSASSSTSSSSGEGASGAGGSGGMGAGGMGTGGAGGTASCDFGAPAPCSGATQLQSIDGDQHNDTRTATGETSEWFDIEVLEAVSSIISFPQLSYTATLVPPAGTSYGLFVYTGNKSGPKCTATPVEGTGTPLAVTDTWSDTPTVDDSRWISIEVRYLSGTACGPTDLWTLTVEGHTHP